MHNVMLCDAMALCVMLQEQYINKRKCSVSLSHSKENLLTQTTFPFLHLQTPDVGINVSTGTHPDFHN